MMTHATQCPSNGTLTDPLIVRLLSTLNRLDPVALESLYEQADDGDVSFEQLAIESGVADERFIAEAYAKHYLMQLFDPPADVPPPVDLSLASRLTPEFCRKHLVAPLSDDGQTIEIAIFSPDSLLLADEIRLTTGRQMRPMFTTLSVIRRLLTAMYQDLNERPRSVVMIDGTDQSTPPPRETVAWVASRSDDPTTTLNQLSPSVQACLSELVGNVLDRGATDIHFEPDANGYRIRLRIDHRLCDEGRLSQERSEEMIRPLIALSGIDADDDVWPQEGRFCLQNGSRRIDVRVNTCPTLSGTKTVFRFSDSLATLHQIETLGMDNADCDRLCQTLNSMDRIGSGLVLVTGPPSSGTNATLAACVNHLNHDFRNVCAIDENVEVPLPGVNHIRIRPDLGLGYAAALRSLLRQDPDVVLVGEMDVRDTAQRCIRAATERIVLSSMVDCDSFNCFAELNAMGIPWSVIARTVDVVVTQRTIRRLCVDCKVEQPLEPELAKRLGIATGRTVFRSRGCPSCFETGFRHRTTVFEVIRVTRSIADAIQKGESSSAIRRTAIAGGARTLRQAAIEKVVTGETSLNEALRVVSIA